MLEVLFLRTGGFTGEYILKMEVFMMPCGSVGNIGKQNYYKLKKEQQILVTINGHSCDSGKKGKITAIPAFGCLTDDSLIEICINKRKTNKRIGVLKERREVLVTLSRILR